MDGNMGFTGIMVAWMGNLDPLIMAGVAFFINFLTRGMAQVCTEFGFTSEALSDTVIGLVYFFFIGCEFFIRYRVHFAGKQKKQPDEQTPAPPRTANKNGRPFPKTRAQRRQTECSPF